MKKIVSNFLILLLAITFNRSAIGADTLTTEVIVPTPEILKIVKSRLKGSKIHLNNYGQLKNYSWHKSNDSYIKAGGVFERFNIEEISRGPFKYYINDINMNSFNISINNGIILARFYLENKGIEIKGRCKGKLYKTGVLCAMGSDDAAPDVHISNAVVYAYLTPVVRNGSISFGKIRVDFKSDIKVGKTCSKLKICRYYIERVKVTLKNKLNTYINKAINNETRNDIANDTRALLKKYGIKRILSLSLGSKNTKVKFRLAID